MREIEASQITLTVARLFKDTNYNLTNDVLEALKQAAQNEESNAGQEILNQIIMNANIAGEGQFPLCQDCGLAVIFLELGQEVHIRGGDLKTAVNEGVRQAYGDGYLRKSVVDHPFTGRLNTQDNTPAIVYIDVVPGDKIKITAMPKGGGAENMSRLGMLTPGAGIAGITEFVVKAVDEAGPNACPPLIVGVGIGGTAEKALLLAKKALIRKVGDSNPDGEVAQLEKDLLEKINRLGIGPMGYGGRITALAVHVEVFPSHIASLPVAVNLNCHSSRHKEAII